MKRPLVTLAFFFLPYCFLGQNELKEWEGEWKGEMLVFNNGKTTSPFKTQMRIQPSKRCKNCWDWVTSYYKDSLTEEFGVVIKDYWMEIDSIQPQNMILHEPDADGIDILFQKNENIIMGSFSINNYDELGNEIPNEQILYYSQYQLEGDQLRFDISYFDYDLKNFGKDELNSNVGQLVPRGIQRSVLIRQKK